ncbi:MAG: hypothetical protein OES32_01530 [Acidobacteriota bacterium]|nr:hypothetical protein [Acidobacteriota bacterium]
MKRSDSSTPRVSGTEKKVYRRPATLSRERLEALAVICDTGKVDPLACPAGPIQS